MEKNKAGKDEDCLRRDALFIFGGPSMVEWVDNGAIFDKSRFVSFVEIRALTPRLLATGFRPDYVYAPFPEKAQENQLHHWVYRALLAGMNIEWLLKPIFRPIARDMKRRFSDYFEVWNPDKGIHKKFRFRSGLSLPDSPYQLMSMIPDSTIITNVQRWKEVFPRSPYEKNLWSLRTVPQQGIFDLDKYFKPSVSINEVTVTSGKFLNSATIAMFPLAKTIGCNKVYLVGYDMTNLGAVEYSAPFVFRSMHHFHWYVLRSKKAFSASYKINRPFFLRPRSDFDEFQKILQYPNLEIIRVTGGYKHIGAVPGIRSTSFEELI